MSKMNRTASPLLAYPYSNKGEPPKGVRPLPQEFNKVSVSQELCEQGKLKAYIASSSYNRTNVKLLEQLLVPYDICVTSRWFKTPPIIDTSIEDIHLGYKTLRTHTGAIYDRARIDFKDIDRSDILIMQYPWGSGTASEVAYAVAKGKRVYVLVDYYYLDDLPLSVGLVDPSNICTDFEALVDRISSDRSNV